MGYDRPEQPGSNNSGNDASARLIGDAIEMEKSTDASTGTPKFTFKIGASQADSRSPEPVESYPMPQMVLDGRVQHGDGRYVSNDQVDNLVGHARLSDASRNVVLDIDLTLPANAPDGPVQTSLSGRVSRQDGAGRTAGTEATVTHLDGQIVRIGGVPHFRGHVQDNHLGPQPRYVDIPLRKPG